MVQRSKALVRKQDAQVYLDQIRQIPVLSREEERALATRWFETRDREAGQKLVISNLRFVVKIAREYARYGFRMADLIQEGNLGLLHALDRFDPRKGFRLISYAVWWIRAYIQAYVLRSWSIVRMGTTRIQRRIFASLQKARSRIAAMSTGEPIENKQLAAALDVSESEFNQALSRIQKRDVSLDQPVHPEDRTLSLVDTIADDRPNAEEKLISSDVRKKVRTKLGEVYDKLSSREKYLLENRIMSDQPVTLEAAGHEFGVTRERVRQIEDRLKGRLKTLMAPAISA